MTREVQNRENIDFTLTKDGVLLYQRNLCVPNVDKLRREILKVAHTSPYLMHLRGKKMYQNVNENHWRNGMKRHNTEFILKFLVCLQVKEEHQV